jgi:hypothetical protein
MLLLLLLVAVAMLLPELLSMLLLLPLLHLFSTCSRAEAVAATLPPSRYCTTRGTAAEDASSSCSSSRHVAPRCPVCLYGGLQLPLLRLLCQRRRVEDDQAVLVQPGADVAARLNHLQEQQ